MAVWQYDPERRCLPVTEWPAASQEAWRDALTPGHILDDDGAASQWAEATIHARVTAYGRYLGFLDRAGLLDPATGPEDHVTPELVRVYVERIDGQMATISVWNMVMHLHAISKAMAPDADWIWLRKIVNALNRRHRRAGKKEKPLVHPRRIWNAGFKLMGEAQADETIKPLRQASRFRDGFMLALQSARGFRRKNLSNLEIGRNLMRNGDGFTVLFSRAEMKNKRRHEVAVPDKLVPYLERYLSTFRPRLLQGGNTQMLWISEYGLVMKKGSVHERFVKLTTRLVGERIPVNRCRQGIATALAIESPKHARMATPLLGHTNNAVTEKHYVQAWQLEAARRQGQLIKNLRGQLACRDENQQTR